MKIPVALLGAFLFIGAGCSADEESASQLSTADDTTFTSETIETQSGLDAADSLLAQASTSSGEGEELACSAGGLKSDATKNPTGNRRADARLTAVIEAAVTCNFEKLSSHIGPEFTASFGGGDAIELWTNEEANGGDVLKQLVTVTKTEPSFAEGVYTWPGFFTSWACGDEVTANLAADMEAVGFDPQADCVDNPFDGYGGYRLLLSEEGTMQAFVTGD